jgi:hypothetical protein
VHSFSRPDARSDTSTGSAYDERAGRLFWEAMRMLVAEVLR